jgi:hypothetical protein
MMNDERGTQAFSSSFIIHRSSLLFKATFYLSIRILKPQKFLLELLWRWRVEARGLKASRAFLPIEVTGAFGLTGGE